MEPYTIVIGGEQYAGTEKLIQCSDVIKAMLNNTNLNEGKFRLIEFKEMSWYHFNLLYNHINGDSTLLINFGNVMQIWNVAARLMFEDICEQCSQFIIADDDYYHLPEYKKLAQKNFFEGLGSLKTQKYIEELKEEYFFSSGYSYDHITVCVTWGPHIAFLKDSSIPPLKNVMSVCFVNDIIFARTYDRITKIYIFVSGQNKWKLHYKSELEHWHQHEKPYLGPFAITDQGDVCIKYNRGSILLFSSINLDVIKSVECPDLLLSTSDQCLFDHGLYFVGDKTLVSWANRVGGEEKSMYGYVMLNIDENENSWRWGKWKNEDEYLASDNSWRWGKWENEAGHLDSKFAKAIISKGTVSTILYVNNLGEILIWEKIFWDSAGIHDCPKIIQKLSILNGGIQSMFETDGNVIHIFKTETCEFPFTLPITIEIVIPQGKTYKLVIRSVPWHKFSYLWESIEKGFADFVPYKPRDVSRLVPFEFKNTVDEIDEIATHKCNAYGKIIESPSLSDPSDILGPGRSIGGSIERLGRRPFNYFNDKSIKFNDKSNLFDKLLLIKQTLGKMTKFSNKE